MKRILCILLMSFVIASPVIATGTSTPIVDVSRANEGVATVNHRSNRQLAVVVEKDGKSEQYILSGINSSIPLQLGSGEYLIKTLEHKEGISYRVIDKTNVYVKMANENSVYLQSIQQINFSDESAAIKEAERLSRGLRSKQAKFARIYAYIISNVSYDHNKVEGLPNTYLPDIDDTFATNKGICYDYASMLAGMLRSQGIPTKLVKGYVEGSTEYHAWNEVYINGQWRVIDTTADATYHKHQMDFNMYKPAVQYGNITGYY